MTAIPTFTFYWDNNRDLLEQIQPNLWLRSWRDLSMEEKNTAYNELRNKWWLDQWDKILKTIQALNNEFLRECPWKKLHTNEGKIQYESEKIKYAMQDYFEIFISEQNEVLVYRMLSIFAYQYIDQWHINMIKKSQTPEEKHAEYIEEAFKKFDKLSNCLNHIFSQFSINITITRDWLFPKQDTLIEENLVLPTLLKLSDPKWLNVNSDFSKAIDAYHKWDYPTSISLIHTGIQRFLQILLSQEESKNGQWEFWKLLSLARKNWTFWNSELSQAIESWIQSFISNMRANKSASKPLKIAPTENDVLLMLNLSLLLVQQAKLD